MSVEIDLAELMRRAQDSRVADIMTGIPAQVKEYFPGKDPTADLIIVTKRALPTDDETTVYESIPVLPNVPILFPRGGGGTYAITWPLHPGDHVWVMISVYAFSQWRNSGQVSEPGDLRLHSLGNCYAVPGASPKSEDMSQSSIVAMVIEAPEIRLGKNATDFAALASKVDKNHDDIVTTLGSGAAGGTPVIFGTPYVKTAVAAAKTKVE